jgi:hypothetical protein
MVDKSRRSFFGNLFKELVRDSVSAFENGREQARGDEEFDEFFSSYESSYALTLCYPDDILLETARKEGIPCEGREKADIVKDLFLKSRQDQSGHDER